MLRINQTKYASIWSRIVIGVVGGSLTILGGLIQLITLNKIYVVWHFQFSIYCLINDQSIKKMWMARNEK